VKGESGQQSIFDLNTKREERRTCELGNTVIICRPSSAEEGLRVLGAGEGREKAGAFASYLGFLVHEVGSGNWVA
jgi:hypothetical protein